MISVEHELGTGKNSGIIAKYHDESDNKIICSNLHTYINQTNHNSNNMKMQSKQNALAIAIPQAHGPKDAKQIAGLSHI